MKLYPLSACPLLLLGALGPHLSAGAAEAGFLEDSQLVLNQRNFYFHRNYLNNPGGQNYREEWAHGMSLDYVSGYTQGTVGFGIDAYANLGLKLDSGRGRTGTDLLPVDSSGRPEDEYSELGSAVKLRLSRTELKYGSLAPLNPVFGTGNARLFTPMAIGFSLNSREFDDLLLDAGHFTAGNDGNSTNSDGALKALYAQVETRRVDYAGLLWAPDNGTSLSAYGSRFDDIWHQYYFNASRRLQLDAGRALSFDFNLYRTEDQGRQLAGEIDNTAWSATVRYAQGPHALSLAHQRVHGDEPFDYLGFDRQSGASIFLANSVQVLDFNGPNERSWQVRYDLDLAAFGVPGLSFMSRYVSGDHIDDSRYQGGPNGAYGRYGEDGKRWERDVELRYLVQSGPARDLSVRLRQASIRSSAEVARADTADNNELRVIIDYPLQLL
ncbi:OprD family porin [Metapseudomonas resinovorans]|uniref:Putative proline-specific porin OpdB n=1 Tax=Metapseudomonas resinovorans NBRC 106553 TaxID=1245471 RepID=S6ALE0_METRE|nr:OprD family porin [Pseudomonas resinovorans]BAN49560.1 putative proline-specific porin OpdB [Pseudomonas resinovorans NBRC 106553]